MKLGVCIRLNSDTIPRLSKICLLAGILPDEGILLKISNQADRNINSLNLYSYLLLVYIHLHPLRPSIQYEP